MPGQQIQLSGELNLNVNEKQHQYISNKIQTQ